MTALAPLRLRRKSDAGVQRKLAIVAGFSLILTQRIGLPLGSAQIPVPLLLSLALLFAAIAGAAALLSPVRLCLLLAVTVAGGISLARAENSSEITPAASPLSLAFLILVYLWFVVVPTPSGAYLGPALLRGVLLGVSVGASLGIAQWGAQTAGLGYIDFVGGISPEFRLQGYNTYYTLDYVEGYRSDGFKPNGMIFLEPSNLSLFAGIGIIILLSGLNDRAFQFKRPVTTWVLLGVLTGGLAVSLSTSGVLVAAIGGLVLLAERRLRLWQLLVGGILVAAAAHSGLFRGVAVKLAEGTEGNSSTAQRLTLPYELLPQYWEEEAWLGWGPGTATFFTDLTGYGSLQAPALLKALLEYGVFGTLLLALMLALALRAPLAPLPVTVAILAAYLLPADNLLNVTLVTMLALGCRFWPTRTQNPLPKECS